VSSQAVEQQAHAGEVDQRRATRRKPLVGTAQPSGAPAPREGALDHPAPGPVWRQRPPARRHRQRHDLFGQLRRVRQHDLPGADQQRHLRRQQPHQSATQLRQRRAAYRLAERAQQPHQHRCLPLRALRRRALVMEAQVPLAVNNHGRARDAQRTRCSACASSCTSGWCAFPSSTSVSTRSPRPLCGAKR
jgi:hypothetical protein